ncbi:MAG TPA: hypothetical protein VG225_08290 [Terracidiphilus sp.]|nr:hypothetical protein [Terracidiphilus sp.]
MTYAVRGLGLVFSLVLVSTLAACSLTHLDSQAATASTTPSTAAYVYIQIQGPEGSVYGFRASPTGHLSPIHGSPFKPAGEIVGGTPTKFFTLGKDLIHSYGIASDGVIGSQLSQIPIYDYAGSRCGDPSYAEAQAVLDHTGKYIYVLLQYGYGGCGAYQSYAISSNGDFMFVGDTEMEGTDSEPNPTYLDLPSILGNERFGYADEWTGHDTGLVGFRRESSGTLQLMQFREADPTLPGNFYHPANPDASPTGNYLVVQLYPDDGGDTGPLQFGSYTVDSDGSISTTNTSSNMPTSSLDFPATTFSPSGDLFVAYQGEIDIYKFNGAAPLTLWRTLLSGNWVSQVAFDRSNHLYAISGDNKLYVFTVTSTSVTETSSINIGSPFKMVVVSE